MKFLFLKTWSAKIKPLIDIQEVFKVKVFSVYHYFLE